jgi:hypothetical protein
MVSTGGASVGSSLANGVVLPTKYFILLIVTLTALIALQVKSFLIKSGQETEVSRDHHEAKVAVTYHESKPVLRNPKDQEQCRFYMAESAVAPGAGMGMFTATGLLQGDMIGFPDICIFVSDAPKKWTHLRYGQSIDSQPASLSQKHWICSTTMFSDHLDLSLNVL